MKWLKTYLVAVLLCAAPMAMADPADRVITVSGSGQVDVAPDMATLTLGVTHEAKVASAAMDQVSDSVAQILARLSDMGIEPRDMQTSGLSLNPVWANHNSSTPQRPKISGFVARNSVMVRVRALDGLGAVLDAVIIDGANDLGGIRFGVQQPDPLMDEARRRAVTDAMAKAQVLADAAGVTLGPLQTMSEQGGRGQPMMMEMAASRDGGVPIAAGQVSLSASVTLVFAIAD
jgi:uncharacterized protein YggE